MEKTTGLPVQLLDDNRIYEAAIFYLYPETVAFGQLQTNGSREYWHYEMNMIFSN